MIVNKNRRKFVIGGVAMALISALSYKVFAKAEILNMSEVKKISGAEFWELYFQNRFVTLKRSPTRMQGEYLDVVSKPTIAAKLNRQKIKIEVDRKELKEFDFLNDPRFLRIRFCESDYYRVLEEIQGKTYLYIDHPPFGSQRMSELASDILKEDSEAKFSMRLAIEEMFAEYDVSNSQKLQALLWIGGECRDLSLSKIITHALYEDSKLVKTHKHKLPSSLVNVALEALSKINDKSDIDKLLDIMEREDHSGKLRIAFLMKRMLSADKMLSLEELGENFYSSAFWRKLVKSYRSEEGNDWSELDFKSLYWENRYLAVHRAKKGDKNLVRLLEDEVPVVSDLAKRKML